MRGIFGIIAACSVLFVFGCDNPFPKLEANCQVGLKSDGGAVHHCQFLNYGTKPASGCIQVKVKPTEASPEGGESQIVSERLCAVDVKPLRDIQELECATNAEHGKCGEEPSQMSNYECSTDQKAPDFNRCKARAHTLTMDTAAIEKSCIVNKNGKRVFTCSVVIEEVTAR